MAKKYTPPHIKASKKGSLHTALGVKKGDKIPASKLKIKSTDSPALKKKKQFAINAKKWKHQAGGEARDVHFIKMSISQAQNGASVPNEDPNNPGFDLNGQPVAQSSQYYPDVVQGINMNVDIPGNLAQQSQQGQQHQQYGQQPDQQPNNKIRFLDSPQGKAFNQGVRGITNIANSIQNNKLQHREKLQINENMTPRYMTNENSEGLDNGPAYHMYGGEYKMGGPIPHGSPIGVVESRSGGSGIEDGMDEGWNANSFYGTNQIGRYPSFKTGGSVSSSKAKEILRDGTAQGHSLTDKQKRYFGWIAGGKKQTGGDNPDNGQQDYYDASAKLSYFKDQLNNKLKAKDPQAYDNYLKGLGDIQNQYKAGNIKPQDFIPKRQAYAQNSDYNDYLSPEDVKGTLGQDYDTYLNSLQTVNKYNVKRGQQPLYGQVEGENDPSKLNYGRRFATMTTDNSRDVTINHPNGQSTTQRTVYKYNPKTRQVESQQSEDSTNMASRQTGGYAVGDEVELSAKEIRELKKQGYKIENI